VFVVLSGYVISNVSVAESMISADLSHSDSICDLTRLEIERWLCICRVLPSLRSQASSHGTANSSSENARVPARARDQESQLPHSTIRLLGYVCCVDDSITIP
jgi:hypothetical protein